MTAIGGKPLKTARSYRLHEPPSSQIRPFVVLGDVPVTRRGPSYWGNYSVALMRKIEFGKYYPS